MEEAVFASTRRALAAGHLDLQIGFLAAPEGLGSEDERESGSWNGLHLLIANELEQVFSWVIDAFAKQSSRPEKSSAMCKVMSRALRHGDRCCGRRPIDYALTKQKEMPDFVAGLTTLKEKVCGDEEDQQYQQYQRSAELSTQPLGPRNWSKAFDKLRQRYECTTCFDDANTSSGVETYCTDENTNPMCSSTNKSCCNVLTASNTQLSSGGWDAFTAAPDLATVPPNRCDLVQLHHWPTTDELTVSSFFSLRT